MIELTYVKVPNRCNEPCRVSINVPCSELHKDQVTVTVIGQAINRAGAQEKFIFGSCLNYKEQAEQKLRERPSLIIEHLLYSTCRRLWGPSLAAASGGSGERCFVQTPRETVPIYVKNTKQGGPLD